MKAFVEQHERDMQTFNQQAFEEIAVLFAALDRPYDEQRALLARIIGVADV